LIEQKFGIDQGVTSVGSLLAKLQLRRRRNLCNVRICEIPKRLPFGGDKRIRGWPGRLNATERRFCFGMSLGFAPIPFTVKLGELRGQTPVVYRLGLRQSISAASAAGSRGEFWFCTYYAGGLNGELFVQSLRQLMHRRRKPVRLILDSLPAHNTRIVRDYVESRHGKLSLHLLPGYAPELNSDELLWSHVKRTGAARRPLQQGEKLAGRIDQQLAGLHDGPKLVRPFFHAPLRRLYS
jgi:transposase